MRNGRSFFEDLKLKFTLKNLIKIFFLLIICVVHVRFIHNSLLVLPYYVSPISKTINADIVSTYKDVDHSSSNYSESKTTTFNVEIAFTYDGRKYNTSEVINGFSYRSLESGDKVKYTFIRGMPSLGHIRDNIYIRTNHWMMSLILVLFDIFIFCFIPWIRKRIFGRMILEEEMNEKERSALHELREKLKPFELTHSAFQESPKISLSWANLISLLIWLTAFFILTYSTYDVHIGLCHSLYDDGSGLFFPSDNVLHLFVGVPCCLLVSLLLSRIINYLIRPIGFSCEIWAIKNAFRWVNFKISTEEILNTYDVQRILRFNLKRKKLLFLVLTSLFIWIGLIFWTASSYIKVNDSGIEVSTMYSFEKKDWRDVKLYRIALDAGRNDFVGSHQPVFDLVFTDYSFVNVWSLGLYHTDPKLLMRLIDHMEWRGIESESFTSETMFTREDMGQLRETYKKEIMAVKGYSKKNPYGFYKKHLENKSDLFQSLYKEKGKMKHPGWTIKENDYQNELNQ